jgi:hypothetical protein
MNPNTPHDTADDDTDGHKYVPVDERVPAGEAPPAGADDDEDDPDDTEGHKRYRYNVGVAFD